MLSTALSTPTLMVQVLRPAGEPFVKVKVVSPCAGLKAPPQVLLALAGVATTKFVGSVSMKLALIATTFTVLSTVNVIVLGAFTATVVGLKALAMVGGCKMMMPTLAVPPLEAPRPAVAV